MNLVAMIIIFTLGASTGSAKSPLGDRYVERHIGPCGYSYYRVFKYPAVIHTTK